MTESGVEDNIGGLTPHARQGFQGVPVRWHLPPMTFQQEGAGFDDIGGLGVEETQVPDMGLEALLTQIKHGVGGIGNREKACRRLVDALVRGLGGENNRHQELERAGIIQFRPRRRIMRAQALENKSAFLLVHGTFERPSVLSLGLTYYLGSIFWGRINKPLIVTDTIRVYRANETAAAARHPGIPARRPA